MGYNEQGCCPMFIENRCSIYQDRPHTCRSYDCRIFPAAGMMPVEENKSLIARQVPRWKFSYPDQRDREEHEAVKTAARFMKEHKKSFPEGFVPGNSTQLAILAIKVYDVFLGMDDAAPETDVSNIVERVMTGYEQFEMRAHGL